MVKVHTTWSPTARTTPHFTIPAVEWENLAPPYRYFNEDSIANETTQPRQIYIMALGTDVNLPTAAQLIDGGNGVPIIGVVNAPQQGQDNSGLLQLTAIPTQMAMDYWIIWIQMQTMMGVMMFWKLDLPTPMGMVSSTVPALTLMDL